MRAASPLTDDGQTHNVRVVLGEKAKSYSDEKETEAADEPHASAG